MPGTMSGDCSMATLNPAEWRNRSTSSTATSRSYPRHPSSQLHDSSARPRSGTHSVRWCSIGLTLASASRAPISPTPANNRQSSVAYGGLLTVVQEVCLTCDHLVTYREVVDGGDT